MNTKGRKEQIVRLGRGLEYKLIIQRGKGRNAEFIAGVHFAGKPTRRELRKWRDAIQRGIEPLSDERDLPDVLRTERRNA